MLYIAQGRILHMWVTRLNRVTYKGNTIDAVSSVLASKRGHFWVFGIFSGVVTAAVTWLLHDWFYHWFH
jgi:hypothetical protein